MSWGDKEMKKIPLALYWVLLALLNGCCWNGPNIGTPSFDRTVEKTNILTLAKSNINPAYKAIQVGMTKEQVLSAWGKPTGNSPDGDLFYSNYNQASIQHPSLYEIHFDNGMVYQITESIWSNKAWMCRTADL